MTQLDFTTAGIWNGGFYELALELGERSDDRLFLALNALWTHPSLEGCYLFCDREPQEQARISPTLELLESGQHLWGLAKLPNSRRVPCGTVPIREDSGVDWLVLYITMGALEQIYDVRGFPFDKDLERDEAWRRPIESWFAEVGAHVFETISFRLGLIGMEISGETYAKDVVSTGIPKRREGGFLWPEDGSLRYYPRNTNSV